VNRQEFHDFFMTEVVAENNQQLLQRMRVLDQHGRVPEEEWEVAGLYVVFAFGKA
jgi:hypothetical protein